MTKSKRTRPCRYVGELGKRTPRPRVPQPSAEELATQGIAAGMDGYFVAREAALVRRETELMDQLLAHHNIARDDPTCWKQLAFALAKAHVDAFQWASSPGRPRNLPRIKAKRSRGAPRKRTSKGDMSLLARLEIGKELLRKQGQKVTNVKALEAAYAEYFAAKRGRKAPPRHKILELARTDAKRVSTARKALQKISK